MKAKAFIFNKKGDWGNSPTRIAIFGIPKISVNLDTQIQFLLSIIGANTIIP